MQYYPRPRGQSCASIPPLSNEESTHVATALAALKSAIAAHGGNLPFDQFMNLALYAPGFGYYVSGNQKFGAHGDFVTAPELSPLFSQCLAAQCAEVLAQLDRGEILEFGAGSGAMAAEILLELERLERLPVRYAIVELSPALRYRQQQHIAERAPHLLDRVSWLERLPEVGFQGVVLANEVLDAMPVHRFRVTAMGMQEQFVRFEDDALRTTWGSVQTAGLTDAVRLVLADVAPVPDLYESEINLRLVPWVSALAERLDAGLVLLIDYGYTRREFFHPERHMGTLVCHFRQRAHADPTLLPGLQDITASVDFTAVAEAARATGLTLAGYTTQANFLFGCGLDNLLSRLDPTPVDAHLKALQMAKLLILPSEMGERFKVIGLTRRIDKRLRGFLVRDLSGRL